MSWKRPNVLDRMRPLLRHLPEKSGGYWIDCGTGGGVFARLLNQRFERGKIVQTDLRSFKNLTGLAFLADVKSLPVRHKSMSGILCAQVLHYVPSNRLVEVIGDVGETLIVGGKMLIIEYSKGRSYPWVPHPFSEQDLIQLTKQHRELIHDATVHDNDQRRPKYGITLSKILDSTKEDKY